MNDSNFLLGIKHQKINLIRQAPAKNNIVIELNIM